MNLKIRITLLLLLMIVVMLFLYPLLHECGHILTAAVMGADILSVEIFPNPHVDLTMEQQSVIPMVMIAFGGSFFPLIFLAAIPNSCYYFYFIKLTIALVSVSSTITSLATSIMFVCGIETAYDDVVILLKYYPEIIFVVVALILPVLIIGMLFIVLTKPLEKTIEFFKKNQPQNAADFV